MNTIKSINIQSLCHESWDGMTSTDGGRHCQSCCKTVTDFSAMSNNEIIAYLAQNHNVCGRVGVAQLAQLNTQLANERLSAKPVLRRLMAAASILLSASYAKATSSNIIDTVQTELSFKSDTTVKANVMGKVAVPVSNTITKISGTVVDDQGEPIPGVTINIIGTTSTVISDAKGKFQISVLQGYNIRIKFIGYETRDFPANKVPHKIVLKSNASMLGGMGAVKMRFHEIAYQRLITAAKNILG